MSKETPSWVKEVPVLDDSDMQALRALYQSIKQEIKDYTEADFTRENTRLIFLAAKSLAAENSSQAMILYFIKNILDCEKPIVLMRQSLEELIAQIEIEKQQRKNLRVLISDNTIRILASKKKEIRDGDFDKVPDLQSLIIKLWPNYNLPMTDEMINLLTYARREMLKQMYGEGYKE